MVDIPIYTMEQEYTSKKESVIEEIRKKGHRDSTMELRLSNFEKNEKIGEFYTFRDYVLNNVNRIRVFLIFYLKEITWTNELRNKFDIHPRDISNILDKFKEYDFIDFKPYSEVDSVLFESVWRQQGNRFYAMRDIVKVYNITEKGLSFGDHLIDDIFDMSKKNQLISKYLEDITNKTNKHREILKNIRKEETTLTRRQITYPDGFIEDKVTLKGKEIETASKLALLENKFKNLPKEEQIKYIGNEEEGSLLLEDKSTGKLVLNENKALAILQEEEQEAIKEIKKNKNKFTYEGKTFNNTQEALKAMEGVSDREAKEVEKEYKDSIKEKLKQYEAENAPKLYAQGYHNEEIKEEKPKSAEEEADDLFKSLGY
jgi:hypothetical protein